MAATHWDGPLSTPSDRRAGFTLIELLIALLLGAVVLGVAFQAMQAHGRFARIQADRASVQQGSRAAVDLVAAELRSADPLGIIEARENSVTARVPRAWGIVCRHTDSELAVLFPSAAVPALEPRDEWIALPAVATSLSWQFLPVTDRTSIAAERTTAVQACEPLRSSIVPAAGLRSQARMYRVREWGGQGGHLGLAAGEVGLERGRPVYVFDAVRYDVSTTTTAPGYWLRRNSGPAMQMQPFVGPLSGSDGLWIRYYAESGEELPSPVEPAANSSIRSIEIRLTVRGRVEVDRRNLVDSTRTRVVLRNPH
jgi:prepilin-type N-terminal cleavage/methylation domain-containing protein